MFLLGLLFYWSQLFFYFKNNSRLFIPEIQEYFKNLVYEVIQISFPKSSEKMPFENEITFGGILKIGGFIFNNPDYFLKVIIENKSCKKSEKGWVKVSMHLNKINKIEHILIKEN